MTPKQIYEKRNGIKRCPRCARVLPLLDFCFSKCRGDFEAYCRECTRADGHDPITRKTHRRKAAEHLDLVPRPEQCARCKTVPPERLVIFAFYPQLIAQWNCAECARINDYTPPELPATLNTITRRTPEQIREQQREAVRRYRARKKWGDW